jgi:hypothetical protein
MGILWDLGDGLIFLVQYLCHKTFSFELIGNDLGYGKALKHKAAFLQGAVRRYGIYPEHGLQRQCLKRVPGLFNPIVVNYPASLIPYFHRITFKPEFIGDDARPHQVPYLFAVGLWILPREIPSNRKHWEPRRKHLMHQRDIPKMSFMKIL